MSGHNILVIDDEEFIRLNLQNILQEEHHRIFLCSSGKEAIATVQNSDFSLVLLDLNLPDMNGIDILRQLKQIQPNLLVIIITGFASVESAVEAIKLGAYDYIKKPFKADAIKLIVKLALETQALKERVKQLLQTHKPTGLNTILGDSAEILKVKHQILEFAKYDSETVLITGESGTGKELISQALHNLSPRHQFDFVEVNCASIPENLLESELFGYEKGAFTDAQSTKKGLLEKADNGTLFLDEIGEMSPSLQAKLLRVLEHKTFRRLGGTKDITVDLRIIAATNKDLHQAITGKEFREDLYYRLNVLRIEVPPLRTRGNDILILAHYFLGQFSKRYNKKPKQLSPAASQELLNYNWPGNIRELKNLVERICILHQSELIDSFSLSVESNIPAETSAEPAANQMLGKIPLDEILFNMEAELIKHALKLSDDNASQAARILKIPRETLRYKIAKYGLSGG